MRIRLLRQDKYGNPVIYEHRYLDMYWEAAMRGMSVEDYAGLLSEEYHVFNGKKLTLYEKAVLVMAAIRYQSANPNRIVRWVEVMKYSGEQSRRIYERPNPFKFPMHHKIAPLLDVDKCKEACYKQRAKEGTANI